MDIWIERDVLIRWSNPLTWLAWLLTTRSRCWYVMICAGHYYSAIYCIAACNTKKHARQVAAKAKEQKDN